MKALFQRALSDARNALDRATLSDRWDRAQKLGYPAAQRAAFRKLLAELEPCLEEEGELALDIAKKLLADQTDFADWEAVSRVADRRPGDRRVLNSALARAVSKSTDGRALPLLLRLGELHPNDSTIQMALGQALLKSGKCPAAILPVLARTFPFLPAPERAELDRFLAPSLAVGLDSPEAQIQQAAAIAQPFSRFAAEVQGVARVLGIATLRLGDLSPSTLDLAANHFTQAIALDPEDTAARAGQRSAWLKSGRHDLSPGPAGGEDATTAALNQVLAWLEGEGSGSEPPLSAAQLEQEPLPADAAWHRDFAVARLRLIEGDNAGAARLLQAAAAQDAELGRVAYYATWAELLLTGQRGRLETWLEEYQEWAGAWTLLSRVWDADPSVTNDKHEYVLGAADPDFAALLLARRALALDGEAPPAPSRAGHCLEEDLEALRIRLGQACVRGELANVSSFLAQPLFRLLPRADRLFWQAIRNCLAGALDTAQAGFLEAAALGHRRAAWALSVQCAQRGKLSEAEAWSQQALGDRHDGRSQLWRRWLAAAGGDSVAQAEIVTGGGRAARAGAYFAVAQADLALRNGAPEEAGRLVTQALATFKGPYPGGRPAPDAALMVAGLQFWLNPVGGAPALSSQWNQVFALPSSPRRNWLLWMVILAKLVRHDPRHVAEAAAMLRELLRQAGPLSDPVRGALARSLVGVLQKSDNAAADEPWLAVLQEIPGTALAGEQQLAMAATAWRRLTTAVDSDPSVAEELSRESAADRANSLLALIAAYAQLQRGHGRAAAELLRQAGQIGGPPWLTAVAEALPGEMPGVAVTGLAAMELDLTSATGLLLRALGEFHGGERVSGFDRVLKAWRLRPEKVPGIFRVSQWVAVVCAGAGGQAPPQLLATVRELGAAARDPQELDRLAHCAAVLSHAGLARELWTRAVDHSTPVRSFDRTDFARHLCHQASIEARASRLGPALALVREAAAQLPGTDRGGVA